MDADTPASDEVGSAGTSPPGSLHRIDYTVRPGDNFWEIARRRVQLGSDNDPTEAEVRDYWVELVGLNAQRLVEPGNPDLLLVGQVLELPG
ncbi:MAG: LysM peptidoglycan-binding domain-containing protein [Microthrixaceae bacterium]